MKTIVFVGDSITEGAADPVAGGWARRVAAGLPAGWQAVQAGVGGDTIQLLLQRLEGDVLAHKPEIVVLAVGINDSRNWAGQAEVPLDAFVQGLETFATRLDSTLPEAAVVVVGLTPVDEQRSMPIDSNLYYPQAAAEVYDSALKQFAQAQGYAYVPVMERFAAAGGAAALTSDGLHPTPQGHAILAAAVAEQLTAYWSAG